MIDRDFERNEPVPGRALVDREYESSLGVYTVVLRRSAHTNDRRVKEAMKEAGYVYHFTRNTVGTHGKMWFRDEENWNLEPGAGNT
jgi:hypothetical protein